MGVVIGCGLLCLDVDIEFELFDVSWCCFYFVVMFCGFGFGILIV